MKVEKGKLQKKLIDKYGEIIGKYIMNKVYNSAETKVDPTKIFNLLHI